LGDEFESGEFFITGVKTVKKIQKEIFRAAVWPTE